MMRKYKVITLCGSTRFKETFMEAQKRLALAGNIVISVGIFGHSENDDKEITKFEDAIRNTGCGKAYFGIAKSDWEGIEIIEPSPYKKDKIRFYAEYYDGMQAPFTVCEWNDDFGKLETLLKNTSDILYSKYQDTIEKEKLS